MKPPVFRLTAIDDPALPEVLAELATARADEMDADTVNRELSIARQAIGWWQRQGWTESDPTIGIERRPAPPDRSTSVVPLERRRQEHLTSRSGAVARRGTSRTRATIPTVLKVWRATTAAAAVTPSGMGRRLAEPLECRFSGA
ncbi:hypothetical protein [Streptomyces bauhiniae]